LAGKVKPNGQLTYKDVAHKPLWRVGMNQIHDLILARQWVHPVPGDQICVWTKEFGLRLNERNVVNALWYAQELFLFGQP